MSLTCFLSRHRIAIFLTLSQNSYHPLFRFFWRLFFHASSSSKHFANSLLPYPFLLLSHPQSSPYSFFFSLPLPFFLPSSPLLSPHSFSLRCKEVSLNGTMRETETMNALCRTIHQHSHSVLLVRRTDDKYLQR